jgi:hypothetical protein
MDLPPVGGGAEVRREDRVELASAIAPVSKPKAAAAAVAEEPLAGNARKKPDPLGDYGYSTDYRRLRGRLEYLEKEQCWKLRYIPIDGATDQYGGSVVLEQSGALAGFRRGDLVEVRGELSARARRARTSPRRTRWQTSALWATDRGAAQAGSFCWTLFVRAEPRIDRRLVGAEFGLAEENVHLAQCRFKAVGGMDEVHLLA